MEDQINFRINEKYFFFIVFLTLQHISICQDILYFQDFENGFGNILIHDIDQEIPINIDTSFHSWRIYNDPFVGNVASVSAFHKGDSEDWLILPEITILKNNTYLSWKARNVIDIWLSMGFSVWISKNGSAIENFTEKIFEKPRKELSTNWETFSIDLSSYVGQRLTIGFKSQNDDTYLLEIDDISIVENPKEVKITKFEPGISMNTSFYGKRNLSIEVLNMGLDTITNFEVEIMLNGNEIKTIIFDSIYLANNKKMTFEIENVNINLGSDQIISCAIRSINDQFNSVTRLIHFDCWGRVPNIIMNDIDGNNYILKDEVEKRPVILDFFATWCSPCNREIVHLNQLSQEKNISIFSITVDNDTSESLKKYKASKEIKPENPLFHFDFDLFRMYNHYVQNVFKAPRIAIPYHIIFCVENDELILKEKLSYTTFEEWVEFLSYCNSIDDFTDVDENSTDENFIISPNPTDDLVYLSNNKDYKFIKISILNSQGKEVYKRKFLSSEDIIISLKTLPNGIYFIKGYKDDGNQISGKIIKFAN